MPPKSNEDESQWHLERKVQLPVLFLIGVQIVGGIWMASALNSRVSSLEEKMGEAKQRFEIITTERDTTRDRLTRMEGRTDQIYEAVRRIEGILNPQRRSDAP